MTDTPKTAPSDHDMERRQQDLECLTLLQQAQSLRMETEYLDSMFAALKGDKVNPDDLAELLDWDDDPPARP